MTKTVETSIGGLKQLYVTTNPEKQFFLRADTNSANAERLVVAGISGGYSINVRKA
jgi:hypothetical protein